MLLGAPVSWGSKKQPSVSLSASKAEYIALSLAIQEGKWVLLIDEREVERNGAKDGETGGRGRRDRRERSEGHLFT